MSALLFFDPYSGGHHGLYLDLLCAHWDRHRPTDELHVAVPHSFADDHPDTWERMQRIEQLHLHGLNDIPDDASLTQKDRLNGQAFGRLIDQTRPRHALALYFDHLQLALGSGLRFDFDVRLSGIYFRPSFHYGRLKPTPEGWRERVLGLRKRAVLRWARRNPHLHALLCLDPFAVEELERSSGHGIAHFLPDPVTVPMDGPTPPSLSLVEEGRRKLLIFGVLDQRKGISQVCAALGRLSTDEQRRLALVLAGPLSTSTEDDSARAIADLERTSGVQVIRDDRFVPDEQIQSLIARSDLVLLTYQRHIGSSNVLVRSVAAGVPVLSTDYGLVGAQVRTRGLGRTVDASDPAAIADALSAWIGDPSTIAFDASSAAAFHAQNTADAYAETVFDALSF